MASIKIVIYLTFLAPFCLAQPWSNVLASTRATDWTKAGLPASFTDKGGSNTETTVNPWTLPTRTQSGSTVNTIGGTCDATHDCTSTINTALSSCADGHYVLLGSGTFSIQGTVVMYNHSCSLRGGGPQSTILSVSGSGQFFMGAASSGGFITLSSSPGAGASTVVGSGTSGTPSAGYVASLNQCDTGYSGSPCAGTTSDNSGLYVCGDNLSCMTDTPASGPQNHQYQTVLITSVSGTCSSSCTLGISPSVYMPNWSTGLTATLTWNQSTYNCIGCGLEDVTVNSSGLSSNDTIQVNNCYACWIKGVRFVGAGAIDPLYINGPVANSLLANNYFFSDISLDGNYPPAFQWQSSTANLFINNISTSGVPGEGVGENVGNVWAYNLGRDTFTLYTENNLFDHHAYGSFDMYEGNQVGVVTEDNTWGTHQLNTYFRNYLPCWDSPYGGLANTRGVVINAYHRMENMIGNAIGTSGQCSTYQGNDAASGVIYGINTSDSLVATTLMRWGNVSVVTQGSDTPANSGVRFVSSEVPTSLASPNAGFSNSVPGSNNLPCSFFLAGYTSTTCTAHPNGGTGLSWWKVCKTWTSFPTSCATSGTQPFPAAGPDVTSGTHVSGYAYDIPATIAWQYLPIDTTYQNSYTITASSWSGGTETLTITSLPSTTHLMGPFQFSGVAGACSSGATFGGNNEILMSGSSSTTVKYALVSDPGSNACTGTMLFPDVRQFDERVYQNDPSSGGGTGGSSTGSGVTTGPGVVKAMQ